MALRDELMAESAPTPNGYTLLVPPDWGRFTADDEGRDQLVALLRRRFAEVGRPDLHAQMRAGLFRQWERMRAQAAIEIFMPVTPPPQGGTPMTVLTAPWVAAGAFEADVRARAQSTAGVEALEDGDGGFVYRWENERRGEGDMEGMITREVTYVRPFPGETPKRGLMIMASILHPGVEDAGPVLEGFTALADAIASTLVWKYS